MGIHWDFTQVPLSFREGRGPRLSHVAGISDSSGCCAMTSGCCCFPGKRIEEQTDKKMPGDQKPGPGGPAVLGPKMGDSTRDSAILGFLSANKE